MKYTRLGDLLVGAGAITEDQLEHALSSQKKAKKRLGETLIAEGAITERQLISALTMQLGIDFVDLTSVELAPELARLVPKNLAKKHAVVPVRVEGDDLYLAMGDPLNFIATEEVKVASKKHVIPMISTQSSIDHAIAVLYGNEGAKRAIREMQQESALESGFDGSVSGKAREAGQSAPSIRLVDSIIERGVSDRASDIHIEPREDDMLVRMRIDGILHDVLVIPKELQQSVISRIKIMCGMDVTERRVPQDGRAIVRVHMRETDLRASTLPTVHGEKTVLRILDRENQQNTAEELGFYGDNLALYNSLLENRQGVILLVGPTGSGKSSTMFTMIQRLNTEAVNIVTLEDPVEYNIEGVNQVQINERVGTTFATGLRSILRQDPDIIAVGEIRDGETARIAMRAAVTGHLVLSTIHTGNALSALDRLHDIGIEPYVAAGALKGIISQRLVRRICPHCREAYQPDEQERRNLGIDDADIRFYRGTGCSECFGTGYRGRSAVAEVLVIDEGLRRAVRESAPHDRLAVAARESGFNPIARNCRELVLSGVTTSEEALRIIYATE
jgi:type IV pilus assembly protein PilB